MVFSVACLAALTLVTGLLIGFLYSFAQHSAGLMAAVK
jgi:hypothetical protein